MHNSATINLHMADFGVKKSVSKIFYSSSACMYPAYNQEDPKNPKCGESTAYPAAPDSEYGWEKLFSERLYFAFSRNYGLKVRVARFHNIFGPEGTWQGGREKAPAALCRKVAEQTDGGEIEIWGDGEADAVFPLYRRVHRGSAAPDAVGIRGSGKHRIGGDGHHQSDGRDDHGDRREEIVDQPRHRPHGRSRPKFR